MFFATSQANNDSIAVFCWQSRPLIRAFTEVYIIEHRSFG